GKRLLGAGDVDAAIAQFRSAIGSELNYAAAHYQYQLGLALIEQGHKDEATQEFQKARALDPHLAVPGKEEEAKPVRRIPKPGHARIPAQLFHTLQPPPG